MVGDWWTATCWRHRPGGLLICMLICKPSVRHPGLARVAGALSWRGAHMDVLHIYMCGDEIFRATRTRCSDDVFRAYSFQGLQLSGLTVIIIGQEETTTTSDPSTAYNRTGRDDDDERPIDGHTAAHPATGQSSASRICRMRAKNRKTGRPVDPSVRQCQSALTWVQPHVFQCLALTFCLPSDTGRDPHPCRCASVCRAERSSMPTPGGPGEPTPPVPGALSAPRAEPRIGEGRPWVPH